MATAVPTLHVPIDAAEAANEEAAAKLQFLTLRAQEWPTVFVVEAMTQLQRIVSERDDADLRQHVRAMLGRLMDIHGRLVAALRPTDYGPAGKDDGTSYVAPANTTLMNMPGKAFRETLAELREEIESELRML